MAHLVEASAASGIHVNTFDSAPVEIIPPPRTIDQPKKVIDRVFTPAHRRIMAEWPLVEKAMGGGDADSFGQLVDYYQPKILRYLSHMIGNPTEAEDLAQVVFLKAWRGRVGYQPRGYTFGAWLKKIAHNEAVDFYRARRPSTTIDEVTVYASDHSNPAVQAEKKEEAEELRGAIQKLNPNYQQAVRMRYLEEMDYSEMAQILGKSKGAIRVDVSRGLSQLRTLLSL